MTTKFPQTERYRRMTARCSLWTFPSLLRMWKLSWYWSYAQFSLRFSEASDHTIYRYRLTSLSRWSLLPSLRHASWDQPRWRPGSTLSSVILPVAGFAGWTLYGLGEDRWRFGRWSNGHTVVASPRHPNFPSRYRCCPHRAPESLYVLFTGNGKTCATIRWKTQWKKRGSIWSIPMAHEEKGVYTFIWSFGIFRGLGRHVGVFLTGFAHIIANPTLNIRFPGHKLYSCRKTPKLQLLYKHL